VAPVVSFVPIADAPRIDGIAVVVDVMRAFTTAAWAFALGVERIILTDTLAEALRLKAAIPGSLALKDDEPEPGFDLTNSPVMLREQTGLTGRTIVQRTNHGTQGAVAARNAGRRYCASFACARATAAAICQAGDGEVGFVITGDDGTAAEDRACAEYIAALIERPATDAGPYLAMAAASRAAARLHVRAAGDARGVHEDDVTLCLEADRFAFAMEARGEEGLLVLRRRHVP